MKNAFEHNGNLPPSRVLPIDRLTAVFNDTTNAYKFYWFKAILQSLREGNVGDISRRELVERMFEQVWYPLNYYKLSFGKLDSFKKLAALVNERAFIDNAPGATSVIAQVNQRFTIQERKWFYLELSKLYQYVPYRFIRPFFQQQTAGIKDHEVKGEIIRLAKESWLTDQSICPYHYNDDGIVLHPIWKEYFLEHLSILEGFVHWNLVQFLQRNNPNIAGVPQKLFKPEVRNLTKARHAWDAYYINKTELRCIYSDAPLPTNFTLDHYIPWSFVVHDLNWNITPVSRQVNSSKNDALPHARYLELFTALQYDFFHLIRERSGFSVVLEDYALLFQDEIHVISELGEEVFKTRLVETITPMLQIAKNAGFKNEWIYRA